MSRLKPFKDVSEHEILGLFAYNGSAASAGTFVKVAGATTGAALNDDLAVNANAGGAFTNAVSPHFNLPARVTTVGTGERAVGMLLYDVALTDENGEQYKFHPDKAAADNIILTGQAAPIAKRGIFAIQINGDPVIGSPVYTDANGYATPTGEGNGKDVVGIFLGPGDSDGYALCQITTPTFADRNLGA